MPDRAKSQSVNVASQRKRSARGPASAQAFHGAPNVPLTVSRPELLVNGSDAEFRKLVHNLFGFFGLHERIRTGHARTIGLAGVEYTVLISILHLSGEGEVNVKTVADHLHLSGAFITTTTRKLMQMGLIHKTVDEADRRRVTLEVSGEARASLERLAPIQRRINDIEFACLSGDEFRALNSLLERMIQCGDRAVALQNFLLDQKEAEDADRT